MLLFTKSRHKPNLESTSIYGFSLDLEGKNGGVLSMRMQVILDSLFARPGSAPIGGGKKGEFRDWTKANSKFPVGRHVVDSSDALIVKNMRSEDDGVLQLQSGKPAGKCERLSKVNSAM